jgi:hypothetical protein
MKILALLLAVTCTPLSAHGNAPSSSQASPPPTTADIDARVARFRHIQVPFRRTGLSAKEQQMVGKLVEAAQYLDNIFWRQNDPEALALYKSIADSSDPKSAALRRYLKINASRFDLIDENRPFVGTESMPPGRGLYPKGLSRGEIEDYVKKHPGQKDAIYSSTTVIKRSGDQLVAVPYHVEYREFLQPAANALHAAARLSDDSAFAKFLGLRAEALLNDDYYASDVAWVRLDDPKFDIIMAPYETYNDGVLGVKGTYGSAVLIRNEAESSKLAVFQKYVADIQDALPLEKSALPSKRGWLTPMEVMDNPFRSGDMTHGYQAVADNLPNDAVFHEKLGTKKIFFKDFMDARVDSIVVPIGKSLLPPQQAQQVSGAGYLADVLMHEISHGLGPAFAKRDGKQITIREALGPIFNTTEEAKADVVGQFALQWMIDHDHLPRAKAQEYYASEIAGDLRSVRFGTAEAHGRGAMMELNVLIEHGALALQDGKYMIDFAKVPAAFAVIAKELLEIEATGDRERAEKWFDRYGNMPEQMRTALAQCKDVPVDVDPEFAFAEPVR